MTIDSNDVTFIQAGSGAVTRTVRDRLRETVSVKDFGAVGDGTTDDHTAFANAIASLGDNGGQLFVPEGRYRLSQRLQLTRGLHLVGERQGSNPGFVGGTTYAYPTYVLGSVLYFDAGIGGLLLYEHTDEADTDTVRNDINANGGNSAYWEFPAARDSIIENLAILSAGAGGAAGHGIETRSVVTLRNLRIQGFGGNGVEISATSDVSSPGTNFGNASLSILENVLCVLNGGDGFHIEGRDANVIKLDSCNAQLNGGWGFNDDGLLGNSYLNCHAATNTAGSFRATSTVGVHTYLGCYIETGTGNQTSLTDACTVIGGLMASGTYHPAAPPAFVLGAGLSVGKPLRHLNRRDASYPVGFSAGYDDGKVCFAFGAAEDNIGLDQGAMGWKMHYRFTGTRWFSLAYANSHGAIAIQFPTTGASPRTYGPSLPNGFSFGDSGGGGYVSEATAIPTSGAYAQGDFVKNKNYALANGKVLLGWARLTTGSGHVVNTDWAACYATNS